MYSSKCNAGPFFAADRGVPFLLLSPFSALYPYDFVFNSDKPATSRLFRFALCSKCTNARERNKEKEERFVSYRFDEFVDLSGYVCWKRRNLTRTASCPRFTRYTHERRDSKRANARVHPRDSFAATYVHCNHARTSISVPTRFLFGRFFRSLTSESRIILANRRRVRSSLTEISS